METTQAKTVKTTLNLDASVKQRIEALTKRRVIKNQAEFINSSLRKSLSNVRTLLSPHFQSTRVSLFLLRVAVSEEWNQSVNKKAKNKR